ncbi:MAG: hypothetical protein RLZZ158_2169 [Cyanobacteriota bacterium]|jgi:hypothetical protein
MLHRRLAVAAFPLNRTPAQDHGKAFLGANRHEGPAMGWRHLQSASRTQANYKWKPAPNFALGLP